jgi:hypothetical protein
MNVDGGKNIFGRLGQFPTAESLVSIFILQHGRRAGYGEGENP